LIHSYCERFGKKYGREVRFRAAYWTPPLPERAALALERGQIEYELGLGAMVSITDHDSIDAPMHLQLFEDVNRTPVSVEWTVPVGATSLHLGVHNLPPSQAYGWVGAMLGYSNRPSPARLAEILETLDSDPGVLVVLNHPAWDETAAGGRLHAAAVQEFIRNFGHWIHALEINGLRPWAENRQVIDLADVNGLPLVGGGDRHGCEPAAFVNLTRAESFAEFVSEVRRGYSRILMMPQYREPFRRRYLQAVWDVLRDYPEYAGRERWSDRVYLVDANGCAHTLSSVWGAQEPSSAGFALALLRLFNRMRARPALRAGLPPNEAMPGES